MRPSRLWWLMRSMRLSAQVCAALQAGHPSWHAALFVHVRWHAWLIPWTVGCCCPLTVKCNLITWPAWTVTLVSNCCSSSQWQRSTPMAYAWLHIYLQHQQQLHVWLMNTCSTTQ
jgi:hypothetical protein